MQLFAQNDLDDSTSVEIVDHDTVILSVNPTTKPVAECEVGPNDHQSVAFRCAKGIINNVVDTIKLPFNIGKLALLGQQKINECNNDPEIKRGLLLVVEPLLVQGIDHWMSVDCGRLMEVARLQEKQFTTNVMRKIRRQKKIDAMAASSPSPLSKAQKKVIEQARKNAELSPEEEQFWQRKSARDQALALLRSGPNIEDVWGAAKCISVRDALAGLCQVVADVALGGGAAIVAKQGARVAKRALTEGSTRAVVVAERALTRAENAIEQRRISREGTGVETLPVDKTKSETFSLNTTPEEKLRVYNENMKSHGLSVGNDGRVVVTNSQTSVLGTIIDRLQKKYGVEVSTQSNGFSSLIQGTNPQTGITGINIGPNSLLQPRLTLQRLQELESRLRNQRKSGVLHDTTGEQLIITDVSRPLAKSIVAIETRYGVKVTPSRRRPEDFEAGSNFIINRKNGSIEVNPELLRVGQERRLRRELDGVLARRLESDRLVRQSLAQQHGVKVSSTGDLTVTNPKTNIGKMIAALKRKGVRVNIDESNFDGDMSSAGGFARDGELIAIRPEYFNAGRESDLIELLNHEITHITTSRRSRPPVATGSREAIPGSLIPTTRLTSTVERTYAGRHIEFHQDPSAKGTGFPKGYGEYFRADELEARIRENNIGRRNGTQSRSARLAGKEAVEFADKQIQLMKSARAFAPDNIVKYKGYSEVVFQVKTAHGDVSVMVRVQDSGLSDKAIAEQAQLIMAERIRSVERRRARLLGN